MTIQLTSKERKKLFLARKKNYIYIYIYVYIIVYISIKVMRLKVNKSIKSN